MHGADAAVLAAPPAFAAFCEAAQPFIMSSRFGAKRQDRDPVRPEQEMADTGATGSPPAWG